MIVARVIGRDAAIYAAVYSWMVTGGARTYVDWVWIREAVGRCGTGQV
jgi:hypothetical protein